MSWIDRNRLWILLALIAVTTVLVAGTVAAGVIAVLAGLLGGASVGAVLVDAALFLSFATILVATDVALGIAFLVTVMRRASMPKSARVADWFSRIERVLPPLAALGLADRFGPPLAAKRERLKQRYVSGELTEPEYERELKILLDEEYETAVDADDVDRIEAKLLGDEDGTEPSESSDPSEPSRASDVPESTEPHEERHREYDVS